MGGLTVKRLLSPMPVLSALFTFLAGSFRSRTALQIEILALRHQLNVLQRSVKRPRLSATDRWLWARLSRRWPEWRRWLVIVKTAGSPVEEARPLSFGALSGHTESLPVACTALLLAEFL